MTQGSFLFGSVSALVYVLFMSSAAHAAAPMTVATSSASAEVCTSLDEQIMTIRGFGETLGTLVVYNADPTKKPVVKDGFTFRKDAGGITRKNDVTLEMFELMAEPFGSTTLKPRALWKKAYEVLFDGKITVIDDQAKELGTVPMTCAAAMVDYL